MSEEFNVEKVLSKRVVNNKVISIHLESLRNHKHNHKFLGHKHNHFFNLFFGFILPYFTDGILAEMGWLQLQT